MSAYCLKLTSFFCCFFLMLNFTRHLRNFHKYQHLFSSFRSVLPDGPETNFLCSHLYGQTIILHVKLSRPRWLKLFFKWEISLCIMSTQRWIESILTLCPHLPDCPLSVAIVARHIFPYFTSILFSSKQTTLLHKGYKFSKKLSKIFLGHLLSTLTINETVMPPVCWP